MLRKKRESSGIDCVVVVVVVASVGSSNYYKEPGPKLAAELHD